MARAADIRIGGRAPSAAQVLDGPSSDRPWHDSPDARGAPRSLYVHVPFCTHKCHYCDFYSFVDSRDQQESFIEALLIELRAIARHHRRAGGGGLQTIFVGGGTPSLLRVELWRTLLSALAGEFDLTPIGRPGGEFTVECNPESTSPELMSVLREGGVTRVSIGAQSFDPRHLRTLERLHDPANVARALSLAADAGITRRSIDLMFGVPGQTLAQWHDDLDRALELGTEHLSCYALTYEPGTPMTTRRDRGEFVPAPDDLEAEMYETCVRRLGDGGLDRYEISNFARPGAESTHNLAYWRSHQWYGAGPSASSHVDATRWKNVPRLGEWRRGVVESGGFAPVQDLEPPDLRRHLADLLMMGLRTREGVACSRIEILCEHDPRAFDALERAAGALAHRGLLDRGGARWSATDRGMRLADDVARAFLAALRSVTPDERGAPPNR